MAVVERRLSVKMCCQQLRKTPCGLVCFVLEVSVALVVVGCGGSTPVAASTAHRYTDPTGWSLVYPSWMHLESSTVRGFVSVSEVTIGSFVAARGVLSWSHRGNAGIRVYPPVDSAGRFPSDAVAFRIIYEDGGLALTSAPPASRFPIRLTSFQPSRLPAGARFNATTGETTTASSYAGMPPSVERSVEADGNAYTAVAWAGSGATARLRASLADLISSLSFPPRQKPLPFN